MPEVGDTTMFAVVEATGLLVKVEAVDGSVYIGKLSRFDMEHGDIELFDVRCQHCDSSLSVECRVFLKGPSVRLIHLPPDMKKASFLDWKDPKIQKELKTSLKARRLKGHSGVKNDVAKVKIGKEKNLKKLKKLL
ncbi:small nuclear ribonucleoprotein [Trypanosoma grayi]|uniref:small nuclear ribonucleoprotein n=1 Tax=Trypanosoma grayi TaxID=71804 RepID=UPI0004F41D25|nr:small nuclear ribonucleoprotein [Trypanosoma grayi]KEG14205.1 small nuclear ribonucleoprotein [Trypanosoma grayi]